MKRMDKGRCINERERIGIIRLKKRGYMDRRREDIKMEEERI